MPEPNVSPSKHPPSQKKTSNSTLQARVLEVFLALRDAETPGHKRRELEHWLKEEPARQEEFLRLQRIWTSKELRQALEEVPLPARKRRAPFVVTFASFAAMLLCAVLLGPSLWLSLKADERTAVGEIRAITLPDGSRLVLNTNSAVAFDFDAQERHVELLRGEAWFEVKSNPNMPFNVIAGHTRSTVLGTAFVVRRGSVEDAVALEHGKLRVEALTAAKHSAILEPGQKVTGKNGSLSAVAPDDLSTRLSWKKGWIAFEDQPLSKVIKELARYHSGHIRLMDQSKKDLRVSGLFRIDQIDQALVSVATTARLDVAFLPAGLVMLR